MASSSASRRRFMDMATVRAVTMQRRMSRSWPVWDRPLAARKVERRAKGRAKRVWESLMSAARREKTPRHEGTKARAELVGGAGGGAGSVIELIVLKSGGWLRRLPCDGRKFLSGLGCRCWRWWDCRGHRRGHRYDLISKIDAVVALEPAGKDLLAHAAADEIAGDQQIGAGAAQLE
jgi:hypothetical protein